MSEIEEDGPEDFLGFSVKPTPNPPDKPSSQSRQLKPRRRQPATPWEPRKRAFVDAARRLGLQRLAEAQAGLDQISARTSLGALILAKNESGIVIRHSEDTPQDLVAARTIAMSHGFNLTLLEYVELCKRHLDISPIAALAKIDYVRSQLTEGEFIHVIGYYELVPLEVLRSLPSVSVKVLAPCFTQLSVDLNELFCAGLCAYASELTGFTATSEDVCTWVLDLMPLREEERASLQNGLTADKQERLSGLDPRRAAHAVALSICDLKASPIPANGPGGFCARRAKSERLRLTAGIPSTPEAAWEPVAPTVATRA